MDKKCRRWVGRGIAEVNSGHLARPLINAGICVIMFATPLDVLRFYLPMYPESEILFPTRCISQLASLRNSDWRELVEYIASLSETHEDSLAFSLMMIKFNSCLTCDLDSYRASLGCTTCAKRMVVGFKGSDKALVRKFEEAREEVIAYLEATGQRKLTRRKRVVVQPMLARMAR